jgi:hypothetical protein
MEETSYADQLESVKSFQSTIGKLEKALAQMTQKGANTSLVRKRLDAAHIGLSMLEYVWNQKPQSYSHDDIKEARRVLTGLFPAIKNSYEKLKVGSPQRTLLERRIKALELAVQAIDDVSDK